MSETFDLSTPVASSPSSAPKKETILDRLRSKLQEDVRRPDRVLEVPARPEIRIRFSPNIESKQLKQWRQESGDRKGGEFDSLKFARMVVASTCTGIFFEGEEVVDENGYPCTFASPEIKDMVDAMTPFQAVQKTFQVDPHIEAACLKILEAAGYGDDVEVDDPLKDS